MTLGGRLALGLAVAVVAALGLAWWIDESVFAARVDEQSAPRAVDPAVSPPAIRLPTGLASESPWLVFVLRDGEPIPPGAAPVVAIDRDGRIDVVRGAPPPDDPLEQPLRLAVAVVLPPSGVAGLDARGRAALLAVLGRWSPGRDVRPHLVWRSPTHRDAALDDLWRWAR